MEMYSSRLVNVLLFLLLFFCKLWNICLISVLFVYSFQIIFVTLFAVCSCAKLDNTYLPPPDAQNSGGNFGLAPPNQSNNGNNGNNGNFGGSPQNGFGQNPPQQQGFQPQESQQPPIAILSYENEPNYGDGSYKYSYETGMCKYEWLISYNMLRAIQFSHWNYQTNVFSFLI